MPNIRNPIVAQNPPVEGREIRDASRLSQKSLVEGREIRDASRLSQKSKQITIWESPQSPAAEALSYLQIKSVPVSERIDPKEIRYELRIYPDAVRACGGQYSADEAHKICQAVKGWHWGLDENNRPYCLPRLEALIDNIIKRSARGEV
jgi:hypothetical protein